MQMNSFSILGSSPLIAPLIRPSSSLLLALSLHVLSAPGQHAESSEKSKPAIEHGAVLLSPCLLNAGLKGGEGLLFVPENRAAKDSRTIAVHFMRFVTSNPNKLPPVFILLGGPGDAVSEDRINKGARSKGYSLTRNVINFSKTRDVVIMNQRGNPAAPGLQSDESYRMGRPGTFSKPFATEEASKRLREGAEKTFERWTQLGVDLAGYDIINLVDDLEAIRQAFDYDKICLYGGSFGSQSSLAYMRRYPQHVDRAVLTGVEPLDHGYDSPDGIWAALERVEQMVKDQGKIELPEEGLLGAIKVVVERLEKGPQVVRSRHPRRPAWADVTIGVDDFRTRIHRLRAGRSLREALEYLPKFILDNYDGDYRYIASQAIDDRPEFLQGKMLLSLMDNSLGISDQREEKLNNEAARRWLGDVNWRYVATRDVTPTPEVSDEFRAFSESEIPVLMIQGDLDLSTPLTNAQELIEYLPNGHLIIVKGGTHGALAEIVNTDAKFNQHVEQFLQADFEKTKPGDFYKTLPEEVALPPLNFKTRDKSLFDELINR